MMSPSNSGPRMGATVRPDQRISQYLGSDRVTVTQALARLIGKSEGWCHARLYGCPRLVDLTVAAIRAYRLAHDPKGLAGVAALLRDALEGAPSPRLTPDLILSEQTADFAEDISESAFLLNPCRETAVAYVSKLDTELARSGALRAAVVDRWLA